MVASRLDSALGPILWLPAGEVQEAGGLCCVFMKQHSSILHMACLNPLLPICVSVSPWKLGSTLYLAGVGSHGMLHGMIATP